MPTKDRPANLARASDDNLSSFVQNASASEDHNGRDVLTTAMMRALFLHAISIGVGSAREIVRRANSDVAYCWIVGKMEAVQSAISAFRFGHLEAVEKLMNDVLGALMHKGLVSQERVAQDGTRIGASASASWFRGEVSLLDCQDLVALHAWRSTSDSIPDFDAHAMMLLAWLKERRACRLLRCDN